MISYGICISLFDLLHLAWSFLDPYKLMQMALLRSFCAWAALHLLCARMSVGVQGFCVSAYKQCCCKRGSARLFSKYYFGVRGKVSEQEVWASEINQGAEGFPHVLMGTIQQNVPLEVFKEVSVNFKSVNIHLCTTTHYFNTIK